MTARIWLDGRLVDAAGPHLRVTDRGFQLGDGIFETARARRGVVIELTEHLARLRDSAAALDIRLGVDDTALRTGIAELLAAGSLAGSGADGTAPGDAALRITASRGPLDARGVLPSGVEDLVATIAIHRNSREPLSSATRSANRLARNDSARPSSDRRNGVAYAG